MANRRVRLLRRSVEVQAQRIGRPQYLELLDQIYNGYIEVRISFIDS